MDLLQLQRIQGALKLVNCPRHSKREDTGEQDLITIELASNDEFRYPICMSIPRIVERQANSAGL